VWARNVLSAAHDIRPFHPVSLGAYVGTKETLMKLDMTWISAVLLASAAWGADTMVARAELDSCGGIFLTGDANCEYREREQCMTECKTETVEVACAAKTYTSCESGCTATATTSCESGCTNSCTTTCEEQVADPEPPDCQGLCVSECKTKCENGGRGRRGACCAHNCNKRCEAKCSAEPAPVTKPAQCTETCTNACSGSCTAEASMECQVNCQTKVFDECETETIETCTTTCEDEGGAIFCDGQFVNASNARSCSAELKAKFDFDINIRAEAGNVADDVADGTRDATRTTKKKAKQLCSVAYAGAGGAGGAGAGALLGLCACALVLSRVRRRRAA
jgi:hypothetical protein